jgi:hypothetical protein
MYSGDNHLGFQAGKIDMHLEEGDLRKISFIGSVVPDIDFFPPN